LGGIPRPCRYLSDFAFIMAIRRSVTGSRSANASVAAFRSSVGCSASSHEECSADPFFCSSSSSRKDEDRSTDLIRLPSCCFRKTLNTLILSPSALLTDGGRGAALLRDLLLTELAPYDRVTTNISVAGPSVALTPRAGLAFAMAIHELAGNAAKYGALRRPAAVLRLAGC